MKILDRQFCQIARSFVIRYISFLKEKTYPLAQIQQLQTSLSKFLSNNELKQVVILKLTTLQSKGDYHHIVVLTFLQDLAKWAKQHQKQISNQKMCMETLIDQSIQLLNNQQQFHTIVPKQNELIHSLLILHSTIQNLEKYRILYRKLKDVKQFYPSSVRQGQKILFLRTLQQSIDQCIRTKCIKTLEFIFSNIFCQLEVLEQNHQYLISRIKVIRKIIKNIWFFHNQIMYKSAYLIIKYSQFILTNSHLMNALVSLYQDLMFRLIQKPSLAPLIIFEHLVINNLKKILQKGPQFLSMQIIMSQLTDIFSLEYLPYFMKNYDINFMQIPICQQSLKIIFQFIENRANQKRCEYQAFKKYLKIINEKIREYLHQQESNLKVNAEQQKFYQVKKKEYLDIINDMNTSPKKLFKKIQSISNKQIKQEIIQKYIRIARKSCHFEIKSMIDFFATNNQVSQNLFSEYVNDLIKHCKDANLQEFIRFFTSNFFLTGEGQQIQRVIDKITQLYYLHQSENNRIMRTSDATYTFANAIIILNTDLHNPKNEQKISQQAFIKMCKKINDGQDIPQQILIKTYSNIKKNKINNFRDRSNMVGISPSNLVQICQSQEENSLRYYDNQMKMLDDSFYNYFAYDLLSSIIDQKQTQKLQVLIIRFDYQDNNYECQILQLIRKICKKKPHIPLHAIQKIFQIANFKNTKTNQKSLSYLWLSANLIQNFYANLPTNVICQFLLLTWRLRQQIEDNMCLRQKAQIKMIKKCMRQLQKRNNKKSIMDIFTNFLSSKESDSQINTEQLVTTTKKMNIKILTQKVFDILKLIKSHRIKAIQFFISYLRNEESKLFQQFVSCLYLIFHLLFEFRDNIQLVQDLYYQLLGLKESQITKRIQNLKKKDQKKYNILSMFSNFWLLKIILNNYGNSQVQNKNQDYLLSKALQFVHKTDKQTFQLLYAELSCQKLKQFPFKVIQAFYLNVERIYQTNKKQVKWLIQTYQTLKLEQLSSKQKQNIQILPGNQKNIQETLQKMLKRQKEDQQKIKNQEVQIKPEGKAQDIEDELRRQLTNPMQIKGQKTQVQQNNNENQQDRQPIYQSISSLEVKQQQNVHQKQVQEQKPFVNQEFHNQRIYQAESVNHQEINNQDSSSMPNSAPNYNLSTKINKEASSNVQSVKNSPQIPNEARNPTQKDEIQNDELNEQIARDKPLQIKEQDQQSMVSVPLFML